MAGHSKDQTLQHCGLRAMGVVTFLRISEVCLSFSPHLNTSRENFNLDRHTTFPAQANFMIPELCAGLEAHVQEEELKTSRLKQMIFQGKPLDVDQAPAQADWTANGNPRLLRPTSDYSGVCNERDNVLSGALKDI